MHTSIGTCQTRCPWDLRPFPCIGLVATYSRLTSALGYRKQYEGNEVQRELRYELSHYRTMLLGPPMPSWRVMSRLSDFPRDICIVDVSVRIPAQTHTKLRKGPWSAPGLGH